MAGRNTFADDILAILGEATAPGSFQKSVVLASGESVTYTFSQAVGMGSKVAEHSYIKHFAQKPPDWTLLLHPYHLTRLCSLAIDHQSPLPEKLPSN
jgi:hypothetical protein